MALDYLLSRIKAYFLYLGVDDKALNFINSETFSSGCEIKLPRVCIIAKNRDRESHQSHIHITGENMQVFFSEKELNDNKAIEYSDQPAVVSALNINALNKKPINTRTLGLIDINARTKLSLRKDESKQVQLGEIRKDSSAFNELREGLYENDYLIILRYAEGNKLFIVGIPNNYEENIKAEEPSEPHIDFNKETTIDDAVYQNEIQNSEDVQFSVINKLPVKFDSSTMVDHSTNRPRTDIKLAKNALKKANYKCAFDSKEHPHETFIVLSGHPYLEVHHLIPLSAQGSFINKLDTFANLIPLCPNCHRMIHYGKKETIQKMVTELYESREADLKYSIDNNLTLEKVLKLYE